MRLLEISRDFYRCFEISTDFYGIFRLFPSIFFAERTKIFGVIYHLIILAAKGLFSFFPLFELFLCTYQLHSLFCQNQAACLANI